MAHLTYQPWYLQHRKLLHDVSHRWHLSLYPVTSAGDLIHHSVALVFTSLYQ